MRIHVFVDAENINPKLFELSYKEFRLKYDIYRIDVFSKEYSLPNKYKSYTNKKFNFVVCNHGKNSADTFMTSYIVRAVYEEALTDAFVIITQDRDFAPAIKVVTDNNKQVILVTEKDRVLTNLTSVGVNMKYFSNVEYTISDEQEDINTLDYYKNEIPFVQYKNLQEYDIDRTVFIRTCNRKIIECFFNHGMKVDDFINSLSKETFNRIRKGYPKSKKFTDILRKSLLITKDDRIYCNMDRILEE